MSRKFIKECRKNKKEAKRKLIERKEESEE